MASGPSGAAVYVSSSRFRCPDPLGGQPLRGPRCPRRHATSRARFPPAYPYQGCAIRGCSSTKAVVSETVWSGAGSGCSAFIPQPPWQASMQTSLGLSGCNNRIVADAAAVADPNTGVSVYDTFHQHGWLVFGGTSVSAQIIAAVYALATSNGTVTYGSYPYSHTSGLNDIIGGSNGTCSPYDYLCTGVQYYDGPTGWGTPNGTSGF